MYRADVNPVSAPPPAQMQSPQGAGHTRPLNNSKRAEQNRKAQRAFRERRDQCVSLACLFVYLRILISRHQAREAIGESIGYAGRRSGERR